MTEFQVRFNVTVLVPSGYELLLVHRYVRMLFLPYPGLEVRFDGERNNILKNIECKKVVWDETNDLFEVECLDIDVSGWGFATSLPVKDVEKFATDSGWTMGVG